MFFADEALGSCCLGFDHIVVGDGLGQVGRGIEVLLVSSGAVGIGRERLGLPRVPTSVVDRQACAAADRGL